MKQPQLDKMAKSMVHVANRALKEADSWDEEDMVKMFKDDAADYILISEYIKKGNLSTAAKMMYDLDTASRDMIMNYVYDAVMRHY